MSGELSDAVHPDVLTVELILLQRGYGPHLPGRREGFWVTAYAHPSGVRLRIEHRTPQAGTDGAPHGREEDDPAARRRAREMARRYYEDVCEALGRRPRTAH